MEIRRALVSVTDHRYLDTLVGTLLELKVEVLATPGTARACRALGFSVRDLASFTGIADDFSGRVVTQHPRVHASILAREDLDDLPLGAMGGAPIDLVAMNFSSAVANPAARYDDILSQIDVDGPSVLRAAASNYERVAVVVDPTDYGPLLHMYMQKNGLPTRVLRALATKAMAYVARQDAALAEALSSFDDEGKRRALPQIKAIFLDEVSEFRGGGDNPQQPASFYAVHDAARGTLPQVNLMSTGDDAEPTFHQARDGSVALELLADFDGPTAALIVHRRPACVATAMTLEGACAVVLSAAKNLGLLSDYVIALNLPVDEDTARALCGAAPPCVLAPTFEALEVLRTVPAIKLIAFKSIVAGDRRGSELVPVLGGVLLQARDATAAGEVERARPKSDREPEPDEVRALSFAWRVAKHADSDSAVLARIDPPSVLRTVAVSASATSMLEAIDFAVRQAGTLAEGCVLACDGPLGSRRAIELAARAGVTAIAHAGAPLDDALTVVADASDIALVATGISHRR